MFIIRDKPPSFEEVAGHIARSVIAVAVGMDKDNRPNIVGTGFALEWAEFFATCWHVAEVDDALSHLSSQELEQKGLKDAKLRVALPGQGSYVWREVESKTWIRMVVEKHDICIYRIIGVALPPLHLQAGDQFLWGSDVGVVGFPLGSILKGERLRPYVVKTTISGGLELPLPDGTTSGRLALGATVAGGFSGSPAFSGKDGEVIGMVASKVLEPDASGERWPAGISLAVVPSLIRRALEDATSITTKTIKASPRSYLP